MTEDDARRWLVERYDSARIAVLEEFVTRLIYETGRQNLISASTIQNIWARHIVDSAQLLALAPTTWGRWLDIGSGAGLPGIVIGALSAKHVTLIEPRSLRAAFLQECIGTLGLPNMRVIAKKAAVAEPGMADVVSARAVAELSAIFAMSSAFSSPTTTFILPKGASAQSEVEIARRSWHGRFHVEHSIVDNQSGIVVANGVARR